MGSTIRRTLSSTIMLTMMVMAVLMISASTCSGFSLSSARKLRNHVNTVLEADAGANVSSAVEYYYDGATLDNFAPGGKHQRWMSGQRFHIDQQYWGGVGSPIFVMVGGEGPQGPPSNRTFMGTLAQEHRALMVSVEHRFYGKSQPMSDHSVDALRFLTSQQALADLARLITHIKSEDWSKQASPETRPPLSLKADAATSDVVTFGGSYPGALSGWFRLKYPSVAVGAISSSAPVYADYNFEQYAEVTGYALSAEGANGSADCAAGIRDGVNLLHVLVGSTTQQGTSLDIPEALRPCTPITSDLDLSVYEAGIFGLYQGAVQYSNQSPALPSVGDVCEPYENANSNLAAMAKLFKENNGDCIESSWDNQIAEIKNVTISDDIMRQWIWQSCNEFGFFQTTTSSSKHNLWSVLDSVNYERAGAAICSDGYGVTAPQDTHTDWSNIEYGNRAPGGSNTVYVNGSGDPWHSLGIINATSEFFNSCRALDGSSTSVRCPKQKLGPSDTIVEIPYTSHCQDMRAPKPTDNGHIRWAHQVIREQVAKFV